MALDPVPWFVGGGARHSAAAARNLAWNATGGKTGIATSESLEVKALSTPGGAVQVMPGGAVIESTYQGALQQSYTVRNASATQVSVLSNNTSSTITRYVSIIIEDPTYAGGAPDSIPNGPYNSFRVAGASQNIHPEIRIAKIVIPPQTSTITNAMITDLRVLANPKREEVIFGRPRISDDEVGSTLRASNEAGGEYFPGGGSSPNTFRVTVPSWANRVMIEATWMAVRYASGKNPYGNFWVEYGDEYRPHTWPNQQQLEFATQKFYYNSPGASNDATQANWILMDAKYVSYKLRGKEVTFAFKAGAVGGSGDVSMNGTSGLGMKLTFVEDPDTNPDIV